MRGVLKGDDAELGRGFLDLDEDSLQAFLDESDDEVKASELVSSDVTIRRKRLRHQWEMFWKKAGIDPEQIWLDLCQPGPARRQAISRCQKFLKAYAVTRKRRVISLGPEEYKTERTIRSASTLVSYWRALVAEFDGTLLAEKRKEDSSEIRWSLKSSEGGGSVIGRCEPVTEVHKWIKARADDMGLTREQTFKKKEATKEDIVLILRTVWRRAADIPYSPLTRIAFHNMVLLAGIGGWRPGSLEDILYSDVALHLIQYPRDGRRTLVVTFTIHHNKIETKGIQRDQSKVLEVSFTLVPTKVFCLVSLVVARALADNAFDPPVDSIQTLLSRPNLEYMTRLTFKWRRDLLDKPIFPIKYNTFRILWRRTALVAGWPERLRPYAMRVGAGNRINGVLQPALRNYILSQSSKMFQKSYQPRQIQKDLLSIFHPETTDETELFDLLRHSSLDCDDRAPIYITRADIHTFELTRQDLRNHKQRGDRIQYAQTIRRLSDLLLQERRQKYFEDANYMRRRGMATTGLVDPQQAISHFWRQSVHAQTSTLAAQIVTRLELTTPTPTCEEFSFAENLVAYQKFSAWPTAKDDLADLVQPETEDKIADAHKPAETTDQLAVADKPDRTTRADLVQPEAEDKIADAHKPAETTDQLAVADKPARTIRKVAVMDTYKLSQQRTMLVSGPPKPRCMICPEREPCKDMGALSQHYDRVHGAMFLSPFSCPKCEADVIISGWNEWSAHIESDHGHHNAPKRRAANTGDIECLLCYDTFASVNGLSRHTSGTPHQKTFETPFQCPKCEKEIITSLSQWCSHVALSHGQADKAPRPPPEFKHRCLLCEAELQNEDQHYLRAHLRAFDNAFPCPECLRGGVSQPCLVNNATEWQLHCIIAHRRTTVITKLKPKKPSARCLVCNGHYARVSDHFTKRHIASFPFSCPECKRSGGVPIEIQSRGEWVLHCAAAHADIGAALSTLTADKHSRLERKAKADLAWSKQRVKRPIT